MVYCGSLQGWGCGWAKFRWEAGLAAAELRGLSGESSLEVGASPLGPIMASELFIEERDIDIDNVKIFFQDCSIEL